MAKSPLVLKEKELFGAKSIQIVAIVNKAFQLGIDTDLEAHAKNIDAVLRALRNPNIGNAHALLHVALARQDTANSKHGAFSAPVCDAWMRLGHPEVAAIYEQWFALADAVEIGTEFADTEDAHPVVTNAASINAKCRSLDRKLGALVQDLDFLAEDIPDIVCDMFELDLRPDHKFRDYWIDRIINAPGFAAFAPTMTDDGRPEDDPFGWVTARHVKALLAHGYTYKFAFWEEPIGDTRGNLWIQTDKGPLILSDTTDATSLKTNFPVQVSGLTRKKLFKLRERDLDEKAHRRKGIFDFLGRK